MSVLRRSSTASIGMAFALTACAGCASALRDQSFRESIQTESATNAKVAERLRGCGPDVDFRSTALNDAIEHVRQGSGLNIVVEWNALASFGVTPSTPVTLKLRSATVEHVLDQLVVIADGSGAGGRRYIEYFIDDRAIVITTPEASWRRATTRIYDVRDLLVANDAEPADSEARSERVDELYRFVINTVQPDTWLENGGLASFDYFDGRVAVHGPPQLHRKLERFLAELRKTSATQPNE